MAEKRCLYEVLGLAKTCSQDEIRTAYKKLALQLHPDKLIQTGIPEEQATAGFQELINAYEVLSDPRERSWYDSHREQILYSSPSNSDFDSTLNLFSFFSNSVFSGYSDSGKGFFKVYDDVFRKLYDREVSFASKVGLDKSAVREAPLMGNLESGYNQVSAFYNYWLGFATVMDFSWADQYHASAGPNRKSRRVMEEENKKLRKKGRREYNEMVRGLAEFVKKRDKRVIERQLQKNLEQKEKEEKEMARRKEEERVKLEKARLYEEADWARIDDGIDDLEEEDEDVNGDGRKKDGKELYCIVCSKKFKSDKQWKNHEQSKKHRDKVAELRDSFVEEEILGTQMGRDDENKLCDEFEDTLDFQEGEHDGGSKSKCDIDEAGGFRSSFGDDEENVVSDVEDQENGSDLHCADEEMDILEAMIKGHRTRKTVVMDEPDSSSSKAYDPNTDEMSFKKSDTQRRSHRNREPREESGAKCNTNGDVDTENVKVDSNGIHEKSSSSCDDKNPAKPNNASGNSHMQKTSVDLGGLSQKKNQKPLNQPVDKKALSQNEANTKRKNSAKGKKQKATSKMSDHSCDTCDESFDSRNKLFMHLSSTGHAMLKSR